MNAAALSLATAPRIPRWPSETPLRIIIIAISLALWALLALSIVGLVYGLMIGLFFFFTHVAFVAHVRGTGVRLGPTQFPEIWNRVVALSREAGMPEPPAVYLMQAGGELNAFATKFFGGRIMVLYSELLDACGEDDSARDMVIGHELGHLALRHLDWFLLMAPGRFVPFLGSAYSRACEYSCDRWGATLCGDNEGAMRGLAILAAGARHARRVDLQAYVAQRSDLDTGWMTVGAWLSGYPPLSARIEALRPELGRSVPYSTRGPTHAALLLAAFIAVPAVLTIGVATMWTAVVATQIGQGEPGNASALSDGHDFDSASTALANTQVATDLEALAGVLRDHHGVAGRRIEDIDALEAAWYQLHPDRAFPIDPFDQEPYGLTAEDDTVELFSASGESISVSVEAAQ